MSQKYVTTHNKLTFPAFIANKLFLATRGLLLQQVQSSFEMQLLEPIQQELFDSVNNHATIIALTIFQHLRMPKKMPVADNAAPPNKSSHISTTRNTG